MSSNNNEFNVDTDSKAIWKRLKEGKYNNSIVNQLYSYLLLLIGDNLKTLTYFTKNELLELWKVVKPLIIEARRKLKAKILFLDTFVCYLI